ncbi:MAG: ATP-binding protein [Gluconobacter potus]|uniref:hypothetical protein n=1 Tax=Gluconobacter potus TaxID=2724927 RepID=UPI0039ECAFBB
MEENNKLSVAPADGERRAIRNLKAQYNVAAKLVRDALLDGDLEWVRLVDPEADRLDDVIIGRPRRVDAYQIKWSDYRSNITFRDLITASKVSGKPYPAPFKLLADGWRAIRRDFPDHIVHAHFLTHDAPSASDGKDEKGAGKPKHLQGFLRNAWPSRNTWEQPARSEFRDDWHLKITAISNCTGLSGGDLEEFLAHCELDLAFDLQEAPGSGFERRQRDVAALANFLIEKVASSVGVVHIDRTELLKGLGWTDRFELRFRQDFPVDERLYRPVEETVQALTLALAARDRGYIALVGPPGSGKSTLLTHTLRYKKGVRLVRYYAFVRDDHRLGRGEATAFLHDLYVALAALVPSVGRQRDGDMDVDSLRERITEALTELSTNWSKSGVKTIILIDGLDHIAREQNPSRSLIDELPHPSAIPAGIIFVLGTQHVGLKGLSPSLRPIVAHLEAQHRIIEMARLSRGSIRSIVDAAIDASMLEAESYQRIEDISGGHPLALAYLIKRLVAASTQTEATVVLDSSVSYSGEIEADYRSYWATLDSEPEVRELLGLVSRLRGAVDLATVEELAARETLQRFVQTAAQYFNHDNATSWRFFHNSFRQFVLDATAHNALGRPDQRAAQTFHRRLAEVGASSSASNQVRWERLYHLEHAALPEQLLEIEHQSFFRAQFLAGRGKASIEEDIFRCMTAAAQAGDTLKVLGLLLAHKELGDRTSAFESIDLSTIEVKLSGEENRAEALVSGSQLVVPDNVALEWAGHLDKAGESILASRIFELAEPLDLLSGVDALHAIAKNDVLDAWAKVAWRFRPLPAILAAIDQVRVDTKTTDVAPPSREESRADAYARLRLLENLSLDLQVHASEKLDELHALLEGHTAAGHIALRLNLAQVREAIRKGLASQDAALALANILKVRSIPLVGREEAARIADLICRLRIQSERADAYLDKAGAALVTKSLESRGENAFAPVENLFQQARARAARGQPFDPVIDIPDAQKAHEKGRILFQRVVVLIANVWGEALRGQVLTPSEVTRRLAPVIRFYQRPFGESNRWLDWHYARRASPKFFEHMLGAARAHGNTAFDAVLAATIADWDRDNRDIVKWSIEDRRSLALVAFRIDGDVARTRQIFTALDLETSIDDELYDRVEQRRSSIDGWVELGDKSQAHQARDAMLATSFGVYIDRDNQVADWAQIASKAMLEESDPAFREETGRLMLKILRLLNQNNRGGGRDDATVTLMTTLSRIDPAIALNQNNWLLGGHGAQRSDTLSGIAIGQLASDDADIIANTLIMVARLILPFHLHTSLQLAKAVRTTAFGPKASYPRVSSALETMRTVVSAKVQDRSLFEGLFGTAISKPSSVSLPDGTLTANNGSVLTQRDIEALANNPAALAATLRGATQKGIRWLPILSKLTKPLDRKVFKAIGTWLVDADIGTDEMLKIVEIASSYGDTSLAEIATSALKAVSKSYGWLSWYDGGSRLAVARAFVIADPAGGRQRALRMLVEDYVNQPLSVRDIIAELDGILHILMSEVSWAAVWEQLRQHVGNIAEVTENQDTAPHFSEAPTLHPGEAMPHMLLEAIDHPVRPLAHEARKGLMEIIKTGDPQGYARAGLEAALTQDLNRRTAALATISCLAWRNPLLMRGISSLIIPMAWDAQGLVRRLAQQILTDLGEDLPPRPKPRALPAIYQLHLPKRQMTEHRLRGSAPPRGAPLLDTTDGVDLSSLFHDELYIIESECGIEFSTLTERFAQIMRQLAAPPTWSAEAERQIMSKMKAIGLKMSFNRPRSMVAHQAFGTLVAELCDANLVTWPVDYFDGILLVTDPLIDSIDPRPRPDWLEVPSGEEIGASPNEKWLEAVETVLPHSSVHPQGSVILAEWTSAAGLDSAAAKEARASIISHYQMLLREQMPSLNQLWKNSDYIGLEYPNLYDRLQPPAAVLVGGPKFCDAGFLALNPRLAFHLGWTLSEDGLFRWVDENGQLMSESIWWQDGNLRVHGHSGIGQAAYEGWVVIATREGWKQLRPAIPAFVFHRAAGRSIPDRDSEDGQQIRTCVDKLAIPD